MEHQYKLQAEKIALQGFLSLYGAERNDFFTFFKKICAEKSGAYQHFYNLLRENQIHESSLSIQHKHYLLFAIPRFLPAQERFNLLQLEMHEVIANIKEAIQTPYTQEEEDVWNKYAVYLDKLNQLSQYKFRWFEAEAYTLQEKQELCEAMRYVALQEASQNIENFAKDVSIIHTHAPYQLMFVNYKEHFLGFSVRFLSDAYQIKLKASMDLPTFKSEFAPFLNDYVATHLVRFERVGKEAEVRGSVFDFDFAQVMQHYKNSSQAGKQVDLDLELEARAGKVEIKTNTEIIILREAKAQVRQVFDTPNTQYIWDRFIVTLVAFPLLMVWGVPLHYTVILTIVVWVWHIQNTKSKISIQTYNPKTLPTAVKEFEHEFRILKDVKHNNLQLLHITNFDAILQELWQVVLAQITDKKVPIYLNHPDMAQAQYEYASAVIQALGYGSISQEFLVGTNISQSTCLPLMKYILQKRLHQSHLQFIQIVNSLMENQLDGEIYITSLRTQVTLYQFYKKDQKRGFWWVAPHKWFKQKQKKRNLLKQPQMPTPKYLAEDTPLQRWFEEIVEKIENDTFQEEFRYLKQQFEAMYQSKIQIGTDDFVSPAFYENEEFVLYAF
jgi:hypothetical protein